MEGNKIYKQNKKHKNKKQKQNSSVSETNSKANTQSFCTAQPQRDNWFLKPSQPYKGHVRAVTPIEQNLNKSNKTRNNHNCF